LGDRFPTVFPTVYGACKDAGIDPVREPIPVAPAAHYHMGGIAVDAHGRTNVPGLWACGEVASTGAHGANRLASNSLLEAIVFGARVADAIKAEATGGPTTQLPRTVDYNGHVRPLGAPAQLRKLMTEHVGIERSAVSLTRALEEINRIERAGAGDLGLINMTTTAKFVAAAALLRTESRGGHYRSDYPNADETQQKRRSLTLRELQLVKLGVGALSSIAAAHP
jgi:L-aspartate oxidase